MSVASSVRPRRTRAREASSARADPERRDRLIDGAVRLDREVVLGHPAAVEQARGAVVATSRGHGTVRDAWAVSS